MKWEEPCQTCTNVFRRYEHHEALHDFMCHKCMVSLVQSIRADDNPNNTPVATMSQTAQKQLLSDDHQRYCDVSSIWPETDEDLNYYEECDKATGYTFEQMLALREPRKKVSASNEI